jgi:hypothetical protein
MLTKSNMNHRYSLLTQSLSMQKHHYQHLTTKALIILQKQ